MAIESRSGRLRMSILGAVVLSLFVALVARLWFLQTVQQDELQSEVDATKLRTVPLLPERGRIFDADGRVLADNERVLSVIVDGRRCQHQIWATATDGCWWTTGRRSS